MREHRTLLSWGDERLCFDMVGSNGPWNHLRRTQRQARLLIMVAGAHIDDATVMVELLGEPVGVPARIQRQMMDPSRGGHGLSTGNTRRLGPRVPRLALAPARKTGREVPMIRALGFSENPFDPNDPGRLCRGRERWIEPWEQPDAPSAEPLVRTVVSGATFTDDGAGDAQRGLQWSGIPFVDALTALYPDDLTKSGLQWIAFMEDGHPADIPTEAQGVEAYDGFRAGGRQEIGLVRWYLPIDTTDGLRTFLDGEITEERLRGLVLLDKTVDVDILMASVFELVGFSTLDSPPARYQPAALPDLLGKAAAVVLLHRDKHGPVLTAYTREPVPGLAERMNALCSGTETLLVPFAIPPMLARWDRALSELRAAWPTDTPFPVPKAPEAAHRPWFRDDGEVAPSAEAVPRGRRGRNAAADLPEEE